MRKNVYQSTTKIVVDRETGEIAQIETVKKQKIEINSEPFYMVFIDYMAPIFSLKMAHRNLYYLNYVQWLRLIQDVYH